MQKTLRTVRKSAKVGKISRKQAYDAARKVKSRRVHSHDIPPAPNYRSAPSFTNK